MNEKHLHIVALDVPYPVNHGGIFDLFYKIKTLYHLGIRIHLHCFDYGRGHQEILHQYCISVQYYKRKTGIHGISSKLPYIVSSRVNHQLIFNLSEDNHPILFEGTHCTYPLYRNMFPDRKTLYRLHNIESLYYHKLYQNEHSLSRKVYYALESRLLDTYEKQAAKKASYVLTVSEKDAVVFSAKCPDARIKYLPVFLPFQEINSVAGSGAYFLYHGNLSIIENENVAIELIRFIAPFIHCKLIIAGRNPTHRLLKTAAGNEKVRIIADPADHEMKELIRDAHVHIILSNNNTGIKLKLLHALFEGRHCLVNKAALPDEQIRHMCHVAENHQEMIHTLNLLISLPFTHEEINKRKAGLLPAFDNYVNAQKIIELL